MKDKVKKSVKTTYNNAIPLTPEELKALIEWKANGIEILKKL